MYYIHGMLVVVVVVVVVVVHVVIYNFIHLVHVLPQKKKKLIECSSLAEHATIHSQ